MISTPVGNTSAHIASTAARMRQPRATLFFYEGFISVSPSVVGAALELRARGYQVDLFYTRPSIELLPPHLPQDIRLREHVPWTRRITGPIIERLRRNALERLSRTNVDHVVRKRSSRLRAWARAIISIIEIPQFILFCRARLEPTDLAVAFDMTGLAAMRYTVPATTPFVYWSLEIMLLDEAPDPVSRWLKRHELRHLNEARAVVIQAPARRALFERDAPALDVRYVEVPNSPSQQRPKNIPTDIFTSKFPIPPDAWLVLHAGFISSSFVSLEIARTVPAWPKDFVLVFHERQYRDPLEPYLLAVRQAGGERTFLSLSPVAMDQVDTVYAGADIGLVCYEPAEANLKTAWSSSGKLAYYLRHGLPIVIVANECPSILTDWQCGVWAADPDGVAAALATIAANYDSYSAQALKAYEANFDFGAAFDRLMTVVDGAESQPS